MANYFNTLSLRDQLTQLGKCRFMESSEFSDGVTALKGKKSTLAYTKEQAEEFSKAGYARKVAEMENMRRRRSVSTC